MSKTSLVSVSAAVLVAATGCTAETVSSIDDDVTALISVDPAGGETDVDPNVTVTITFSHEMGMQMYVALHEGADVIGPEVDGTWSWSDNHTTLTFSPADPLKSQTAYTIHMGGGMTDDHGHTIDLEQHGHAMGGEWVTQQMMDDRTKHGGMMGMSGDDMTGPGWQHPDNGTYGMIFTFTTA